MFSLDSSHDWINRLHDLHCQGSHLSGKPGIVREFCVSGKVRELSGNLEVCQGIFLSNEPINILCQGDVRIHSL